MIGKQFLAFLLMQNKTGGKTTTIFLSGGWGRGPGIFIVLVKKFSEPSSVKIFFSHEKESKVKKKFTIMWNRNTFFQLKCKI
jgi:hypothetical protein